MNEDYLVDEMVDNQIKAMKEDRGLMPLDNPADCVVQLAPEREEPANG